VGGVLEEAGARRGTSRDRDVHSPSHPLPTALTGDEVVELRDGDAVGLRYAADELLVEVRAVVDQQELARMCHRDCDRNADGAEGLLAPGALHAVEGRVVEDDDVLQRPITRVGPKGVAGRQHVVGYATAVAVLRRVGRGCLAVVLPQCSLGGVALRANCQDQRLEIVRDAARRRLRGTDSGPAQTASRQAGGQEGAVCEEHCLASLSAG